MKVPFYSNQSLTAINVDIEAKTIHVGVLIVPANAEEVQVIQDTKFFLTEDLINQKDIKVALENDFERYFEGS